MIQIYADGKLTYDSRLEDYDLLGLKVTTGLGKGGTAEIVMPASHPAYNKYTAYRTIVEIYRDGALRFRGRAFYPEDDFSNTRAVICEGELCFLQDGISRPYQYKDIPKDIFTAVVGEYNAQVEAFKQFKLGTISATYSSRPIELESEEAETVLATVNKLTELCGGYIVFTTDSTGARVINWLDTVGNQSPQTIEAGENLFDFNRTGANTDLATALIPYGAKDETTGRRLTIANVNNGNDYIKDKDAVAIRGTIMKTVTWDDVTDPSLLLQQARQYLDEHKHIVTSLTLTALDLSYIDKSIESFKLGDIIRVISRAHEVDEGFQLVEYSEDLLNPAQSYINLGKEIRTLTGLAVAGDSKSRRELQKAVSTVKSESSANVQQTVSKSAEELSGQISKSAEEILAQVDKKYATQEALKAYATTESLKAYATAKALTDEIARLEKRLEALES